MSNDALFQTLHPQDRFLLRDGPLGQYLHMSGDGMTYNRDYAWVGNIRQLAIVNRGHSDLNAHRIRD